MLSSVADGSLGDRASRPAPRRSLAIALGFEFVNGFHDTANAVATVIYTKSLGAEDGGGLVGPLQLPGRLPRAGRRSPSGSSTCCRSTCWSRSARARGWRWSWPC